MTKVWTRAELHLAPPNVARLSPRHDLVTGITLHCTGAPVSGGGGPAKWLQIQHLAMTGALPSGDVYGDHPYNAGVTLGGDVYQGRDNEWVGAHATSSHNVANRTTEGIALLGDGHVVTPEAENAIRLCITFYELRYKRRPVLFDHRDWRNLGGIATACPGAAVVRLTDKLRAELRR